MITAEMLRKPRADEGPLEDQRSHYVYVFINVSGYLRVQIVRAHYSKYEHSNTNQMKHETKNNSVELIVISIYRPLALNTLFNVF